MQFSQDMVYRFYNTVVNKVHVYSLVQQKIE